jgi:4-oxalocrotonate tautomerase
LKESSDANDTGRIVRRTHDGAKRQLAQALTEAAVRTLGGSPDGVDVVFYDIARHDWATGGRLWSDQRPPPPAGS